MAERYIPEHRRTQFKARNQFRPDELRRRREEQQVEIRKQKREENMAKRRGVQTRDGGVGVGGMAAATESDDEASAIESEVSFPFFFLFFSLYFKAYTGNMLWMMLSHGVFVPTLFVLCFYYAIINMDFFFTALLPWGRPLHHGPLLCTTPL